MIDHPAFAGRPDFGKVAVNGVWEEAITFAPGDVPEVHGDDVAVEAFWGKAFFGMRTQDVVAFSRAMTTPDFFAVIAPDVSELAFAEIGAEGAWRSVGPYRLRREPDWEALAASSVWHNTTYDKALEFSFGGGRCWFALPLGRVLQREQVEKVLAAMLLC